MALMFPNQSRSYDATRRAVRFWGHDSAMEWSFFVTEDALRQVDPAMALDEAGMLGRVRFPSGSHLRRGEPGLFARAQGFL